MQQQYWQQSNDYDRHRAKGRFLDVGKVLNGKMLNTLAAAAGVPNVAMGGQQGVVEQMLA